MSCKHSWCLNPVISSGLCEAHKEIEALHKGLASQSCENGAFRDLLARVVCTACDHGISLKRDFEEAGVELGSLTLVSEGTKRWWCAKCQVIHPDGQPCGLLSEEQRPTCAHGRPKDDYCRICESMRRDSEGTTQDDGEGQAAALSEIDR